MDRMGSELNLSVKPSVTIDTMLNFEGDFDGHRYVQTDLNFDHVFFLSTPAADAGTVQLPRR